MHVQEAQRGILKKGPHRHDAQHGEPCLVHLPCQAGLKAAQAKMCTQQVLRRPLEDWHEGMGGWMGEPDPVQLLIDGNNLQMDLV